MRVPGKTARCFAASLGNGIDFAFDISRVKKRQRTGVFRQAA
jgi:hypothetical protein